MNRKQLAIKAAKDVGKLLMNNFGKARKVRKKAKNSLVSDVDLKAEKIIENLIKKHFPNDSILSEEEASITKKSGYKWVIDPLDGTHNYLRNLPYFGVSIALEHKKEVILGVINLPFFNELYTAEKGRGAFMNNKRIRVSNRSLANAYINYDSNFHKESDRKTNIFSKLARETFQIRITGCAVINQTSVANGNLDAHIAFGTNPWDIAAGFLLVREAGGKVTGINNEYISHYAKDFVASNGKLHDGILRLIKEQI